MICCSVCESVLGLFFFFASVEAELMASSAGCLNAHDFFFNCSNDVPVGLQRINVTRRLQYFPPSAECKMQRGRGSVQKSVAYLVQPKQQPQSGGVAIIDRRDSDQLHATVSQSTPVFVLANSLLHQIHLE